jgi:hypothetical protein
MVRNIQDVVAAVDGLAPSGPHDLDLDCLHSLAQEYFSFPEAPAQLDVWFRLYERFPESDGHGVFWAILHAIEAQRGSDEFAVASVRRRPARFPVMMVNRMLNAGTKTVGGVDLLALLVQVAADARNPAGIRREVESYLEYQRRRGESGT